MQRLLTVRSALAAILLLLGIASTSGTLHAAGESAYTFHDSVREVRIAFAASDGHGQAISSLSASDVAVVDNGWVVRNIRSFRPAAEMPLDVVLLLDISGSVKSELPGKIAEISKFLEGPGWTERDRISLLVFGGERTQLLCRFNCRTADVRQMLGSLRSEGQTPLYDALLQAAELLGGGRDPDRRPAMVLISDGSDTISRGSMEAALRAAEELEATDYYAKLYEKMDLLEMDRLFTSRSVNEGFSGGEKKRNEILQLAMLDPKHAVLDETDSGLDIDALKVVANGVNSLRGPDIGILLITHYQRLLNYIVPDHVHVMVQGRIVRSGGKDLALELEEKGYDLVREELAEPAIA
jgi:Mg-chelatase subunit ChlD